MAKKKYYWLRLKENFFTQPKMKKLRKIAGGDTYTIIYLKMQLLSLQNEGLLYFEEIEDDFIEEIALTIDEEVENVRLTILFLMKHGLLEEVSKDEYLLPEALSNIGSETDSAERVRRYRNRINEQKALHCNGDVTICNTEIEKEKDLDIKKEEDDSQGESPAPSKNQFKEYANGNNDLYKSLKDFEKMRNSIKKPMKTDMAKTMLLNKLDKLAANDEMKIEILNQSIFKCWQDVYPLKDNNENNRVHTLKNEVETNNPFIKILDNEL